MPANFWGKSQLLALEFQRSLPRGLMTKLFAMLSGISRRVPFQISLETSLWRGTATRSSVVSAG
jgi:hypothetical protein